MELDDIPTLDLDPHFGGADPSAVSTGGNFHPSRMEKGEARGGKYYRRTPKPGGGWNYFYTREDYERSHGGSAHVSGREAAKDRERAKSGEVVLTKKDLLHRLKHGTYSIVSAGRNPAHADEAELHPEHDKFKARHEELRGELQKRGMKYTEVEGHYGGKEKSFLVYHHDDAKPEKRSRAHDKAMMVHHDGPSEFGAIRELGKKFNQDSVIHSHAGKHEMHYTVGAHEGEHHKGEGHKVLPHAEDFYTHAPTKKGATKFSLNFDFDQYHPKESAVHKSMRFVVPLLKSASHKYISRTPNRSGGYNYVYAHPETGEHVSIETKHKSAAKNAAGARTESHEGGKHVGIMLTHAESQYHDKGGKTESRTHDSLSTHARAMHDHALRDTHEEKTSGAATKPTNRHEVSVSSQERYRGGAAEARKHGGSGTVTKFLIRDPNKPGGKEFHEYHGHGASPGARKTHALKQHAEKHGIAEQVVHSANPRAKGSTPKAPEAQSGESDASLASRLAARRNATPEQHEHAAKSHREAAERESDPDVADMHRQQAQRHAVSAADLRNAAKKSFAHAGAHEGETNMLESTPHLRAQIKMVMAQEDPIAKGLYAFEPGYGKQGVNKIPEDYLAAYLDAFVEEAFESEKQQRVHDTNGVLAGISQPFVGGGANGGVGGDEADWWAQWVFNELVIYCGKNENLMRACNKLNATKDFVAGRLRAMGLVKPAFNGSEVNGDFMEGYQYSEEQTAAGIGKSLAHPDALVSEEAMAKSLDRTLSVRAPIEENVKLEDDGINPVEMLANQHRARFALMQDVFGLDLGIPTTKR
jgi:hypothetical protein